MRYREHPVHAPLNCYLECVWRVFDPQPRSPRPPERVVPDGCPELIVHLADPFARRKDGRWTVQPRAFLAGTLTRPWFLRAGRRVDTMGLRFRPGTAAGVFGISMDEATDREVPLARLVGRTGAQDLLRSLRTATDERGRVDAAQRWLSGRLPGVMPSAGARPAVDLIVRARGQARIDQLARSLGWTRRRMEREFARHLGIGPKLYARIVRLSHVMADLDEAERARAVDLALDAGYFDQAHLLRDFRLLAGRTPRTRREADGEMARHFTRPERLRALLAGE